MLLLASKLASRPLSSATVIVVIAIDSKTGR